jgi:16S rRNA (guanine966-N2)-methyltransferase
MRIIRGTHRGRKITPPAGLPVRPTTDLAKESLFNILDNRIYFKDTRVLDLYAGTGSISYEFASRGSQYVISVDIDPGCIRFISETSAKLGFAGLRAIRSSSLGFLGHCNEKFDLIFADPPYELEGIEELINMVFSRQLLNEEGWLIIEHAREKDFSALPGFFQHRNYGKVNFTFFRK